MSTNDFCKDCMPMNVSILKNSSLHSTFFSLTVWLYKPVLSVCHFCELCFGLSRNIRESSCYELLHRSVALTCPRADRWILHPELLPPCRRIKCLGYAALYCRPSPPAMLPSVSTTSGHIPSHIGSSLWKNTFSVSKTGTFPHLQKNKWLFLGIYYWRSSLLVSMPCIRSEHHCDLIP